MSALSNMANSYAKGNLIVQILVGIILGTLIGFIGHYYNNLVITKNIVDFVSILGNLFVGALKAVAPILVFILIATAIATRNFGNTKGLKVVVLMYLIGTFLASVTAVVFSFMFPTELYLQNAHVDINTAPMALSSVLKDLVFKIVSNPIRALADANYIGILAWAIACGVVFRCASETTKTLFHDASVGITSIVRFIIKLAPFGILGLVANSVYETGFNALIGYAKLLLVLVGAMLFVGFVINAIMSFVMLKRNPFPLIFTCIKESAITAFFTRSSAANIPINLNLCKKLGVDENLYPVTIPLGATINMQGAAVTIAILALAAVHTLGISVSFSDALLLSIIAAISACGASGVAGGSLLLIPLACSLFSISNDIAIQVVAIGFIIGIIQDSTETALNSSTDVLFTAVASEYTKESESKE